MHPFGTTQQEKDHDTQYFGRSGGYHRCTTRDRLDARPGTGRHGQQAHLPHLQRSRAGAGRNASGGHVRLPDSGSGIADHLAGTRRQRAERAHHVLRRAVAAPHDPGSEPRRREAGRHVPRDAAGHPSGDPLPLLPYRSLRERVDLSERSGAVDRKRHEAVCPRDLERCDEGRCGDDHHRRTRDD